MSSVMLVMWCFRSLNITPRKPSCVVDASPTQVQIPLLYPQLSLPHPQLPPRNIHLLEPVMALQRDRPMNTLDLTSVDPQLAHHPLLKHSSTSSSYLILFLSLASSMHSFLGTMTSEMTSGLGAWQWFLRTYTPGQLQVLCRC